MRAPAALYFGLIFLVAAAHPRLSLPLRGWAFPYRMNGSFSLYERGTVNFVPTITSSANASALAARGISSLLWASCWNDPYFSKADPSCTGTQCALKNVTAAVETFASHGVVEQKSGSGAIGRGLDECNINNEKFLNEREVAAQGFREARARDPETIIAAWGANAGDALFASLMREGTFDLAMIEGYTYCAGCGDWPASGKCCTVGPITHWAAYQDRLDFARANGYLNRTLFCFGFMIGQSAINPYGWTAASLRTAMATLKAQYPELAGVIMYGRPPRKDFRTPRMRALRRQTVQHLISFVRPTRSCWSSTRMQLTQQAVQLIPWAVSAWRLRRRRLLLSLDGRRGFLATSR